KIHIINLGSGGCTHYLNPVITSISCFQYIYGSCTACSANISRLMIRKLNSGHVHIPCILHRPIITAVSSLQYVSCILVIGMSLCYHPPCECICKEYVIHKVIHRQGLLIPPGRVTRKGECK